MLVRESLSTEDRLRLRSTNSSPCTLRRGHGTQVVDEQLMATVCGGIKRVDRLVSVLPLKSRSYCFNSGCMGMHKEELESLRSCLQVLSADRRRGCGACN